MTTSSNYDQLVDQAWIHLEEAITAVQQINDLLYPNDGEMGGFRAPRADVGLLKNKVLELANEFKTMQAAQSFSSFPPPSLSPPTPKK